jgi:hypothetical protein
MTINGPVFDYPNFLNWATHESISNYGYQPSLSKYIPLNLKRMQRLDKTASLSEGLRRQLSHPNLKEQLWYVITEAWCGDSAQNLPLIAQMADASAGKIHLQIFLRDENPDIMNQHLTDGSRSIPKLVSFDSESGVILFKWGPRPAPAQALLHQWKQNPNGRSWDDFELELHTWYARDKLATLQDEFYGILQSIILGE